MTLKKSGYWQCQGCGSICVKEADSVTEFFLEAGTAVMGGRTCGSCGTRHEVSDVYSGKFDMRAPNALISAALTDAKHTVWDAKATVWKYIGQELRGSESFESLKPKRPSNVKHICSDDGKIITSTLAVDRYHLTHADVSEIEDLLESVAAQIRERGSFATCILTFVGFDDDPRAVCEIPEVRHWCAAAWSKAPAIVPLIEQKASGTSQMFLYSLLNAKITREGGQGTMVSVAVSNDELFALLKKAAESVAEFLESCGFTQQQSNDYVVKWVTSLGLIE